MIMMVMMMMMDDDDDKKPKTEKQRNVGGRAIQKIEIVKTLDDERDSEVAPEAQWLNRRG